MEETEKYKSEILSLEKQMAIHFQCIEEKIEAESKRIDAIRAIDTGAIAIASEKVAAQAAVLATQVLASSESLRALVTNTNLAVVHQIEQVSTQLTDRITLLEKSKYENEGRSRISAPLLMMIASLIGGVVVFIIQKLIGS